MRRLLALWLGLAVVVAALPARAHPPAVQPAMLFAAGLDGPEGIAFTRRGLAVGSLSGQVRLYAWGGTYSVLGETGERLTGLAAFADGRVLAAAYDTGNIWQITPDGVVSLFASGVAGANFVMVARANRVFVSSTPTGTIQEITTGSPVQRAAGLTYPNGLAVGPDRRLYVAETLLSQVSAFTLNADGTFGPAQVYGTGVLAADGMAFDRAGNLLVAGADTLWVIPAGGGAAQVLSTDPLLFWPSHVAFGRGRGFPKRDLYLPNFGAPLGSGTEIVRIPYNHGGAKVVR